MSLFERYKNDGKATIPLNSVQASAKIRFQEGCKSGKFKEESSSCPVCETSELILISEKDRYGLPYQVKLCKSCGLGITDPRLTAESYQKFYSESYRKLYLGTQVAQEDFFKNQRKRAEPIFYFLEEFIDLSVQTEPKVIVEVGCGAGGILDFFKSKGHEVLGVDYDAEYVTYGAEHHDLNLHYGDIDLLIADETKADLVIYSQVVEHLLDLKSEFLKIKKILKQKGLVYVAVPGIKHIHGDYNYDYMRYVQNAHTYHFSKTTLSNVLHKFGFQVLKSDEIVRLVAQPVEITGDLTVKNDYESIVEYLKWSESKLTPVNVMLRKVRYKMIKLAGATLKILGLYSWANKHFLKSQK